MSEFQIGDVVKVTGNHGNGMVHYFEDDVIATVVGGKDVNGNYYVTDNDATSISPGQYVNEHNLERLPFQVGEKVLVRNGGGLGAFNGEETKAEVIGFGGWLGVSIEDRRQVAALDDPEWTQVVLVEDMETLPLFEEGDQVRFVSGLHRGASGVIVPKPQDRNGIFPLYVNVGSGNSYFGGEVAGADESNLEHVKVEETLDIGRMKDDGPVGEVPAASLTAEELFISGPLSFADEDIVNHPPHYGGFSNGAEVIDITENLSFNGGNAVKYLARSTREDGNNKGNVLEDLRKSLWYVQREIERVEREQNLS